MWFGISKNLAREVVSCGLELARIMTMVTAVTLAIFGVLALAGGLPATIITNNIIAINVMAGGGLAMVVGLAVAYVAHAYRPPPINFD